VTRIALVRHRSVPGGAERSLVTLCRHLPAAGLEPFAVLGEPGPLAGWLADAGCPAVVRSPGGVREAIEAERPDAVLALGAEAHTWSARAAARVGAPAVWWQELTPAERPAERAARLEPTAAIACCNRFGVARQRARTPTLPVVQLAPAQGVDAVAAGRDLGRGVRAALGWEHATVLGMVARLDPAKGQDVFLEAGRALLDRGRDVRLLVVGGAVVHPTGGLRDALHRRARELGLGARVRFVDHVDDPVPWQAALDVSVHPSRHESFCLSLLEALALGTPAVATPTDGARELLDDGGCGVLCPGRADAVADGIDGVLAEPAWARRLADAGRARARRYGAARTAATLAALIAALRAGAPVPSGRDDSSAAASAGPAPAAAARRGPGA
jgi:glycosyltransferase involved in cell wall biosynthesis